MAIKFKVLNKHEEFAANARNLVQLVPGNWDDYSFKTSFQAIFHNPRGHRVNLGTVKIGYVDQPAGWTWEKLPKSFENLPDEWFSLGQDVDYYKALHELSPDEQSVILRALHDVVAEEGFLEVAKNEIVFSNSLMRSVSLSVIHGQFRRVLKGEVVLTDFHFAYRDPGDKRHAPIDIDFKVDTASKPSTNVHVLIGRNGVGKTTLLNNMVGAILSPQLNGNARGHFSEMGTWGGWTVLPKDYFSSVVSVSFSAFDPFLPPVDQPDRTRGVAYFYIGMKNARTRDGVRIDLPPKTDADLVSDFVDSFSSCISQPAKRARWRTAIERLESDPNFADMDLGQLLNMEEAVAIDEARSYAKRMSSGHSIVLLTITKLVDTVEEKTLVLLDEPESHLHPPLLSAFTRALADLLSNRNGVAIIATHSPVVVQEVPRSCVWKLTRLGIQGRNDRPERETFGENVGILTREIFGLEVAKSGFHEILEQAVSRGKSFDQILLDYKGQLGVEAQAILLALIDARESERTDNQ